ncbi:MAG: cytochrome C oxidase subunit IV family protein [Myxococcaceae bacterium]
MKSTLAIGAGLLFFTTLSFGLSKLELGAAAAPVALAIAALKGSAIVWFYMHLKEHGGGARVALLVACCLIAVLISLVLLEAADRAQLANVPGPFLK